MNEWFCYDKEENGSRPLLVLSFSTEMRQGDNLAIRKVIWQAVQSAFAAPLHLLNIMKPCSPPLHTNYTIKWMCRLEKSTEGIKLQPVYEAYVLVQVKVALWTQWHTEERVGQSAASHRTVAEFLLFIKEITAVDLTVIWYYF